MRVTQPPLGTPLNRSHPLAKGLVHCFSVSEGGGLIGANSANTNYNATLLSNATHAYTAHGCALSVPNSTGRTNANSKAITFQLTVAAWYMRIDPNGFNMFVQGEYWYVALGGSNMDTYIGDTLGGVNQLFPTAPALNTWNHYAMTYDGADMYIYINGVQVANSSWAGTIQSITPRFAYGNEYNGTTPMRGFCNGILIYDRALKSTEIRSLYQNTYQMFM